MQSLCCFLDTLLIHTCSIKIFLVELDWGLDGFCHWSEIRLRLLLSFFLSKSFHKFLTILSIYGGKLWIIIFRGGIFTPDWLEFHLNEFLFLRYIKVYAPIREEYFEGHLSLTFSNTICIFISDLFKYFIDFLLVLCFLLHTFEGGFGPTEG